MIEQSSIVDNIGFTEDSALMNIIENDSLLFADKVEKKSHFGWSNHRILAITNYAIYNIDGGKKCKKWKLDLK